MQKYEYIVQILWVNLVYNQIQVKIDRLVEFKFNFLKVCNRIDENKIVTIYWEWLFLKSQPKPLKQVSSGKYNLYKPKNNKRKC